MKNTKSVLIPRCLIILLLPLLFAVAGAVSTYLLVPRHYVSRATIQIHMPGDLGTITSPRVPATFLLTQMEIIKSREVLNKVSEIYDLQQRWGYATPEQTHMKLSRMLDVRELRNTDMLGITVRSRDPEEAATLANGIAEEYKRLRKSLNENHVDTSLKALETNVANMKKRMDALAEERDRLRIELGIVDLQPETFDTPETEPYAVRNLRAAFEALTVKLATDKAQYEQASKMSGEQLTEEVTALRKKLKAKIDTAEPTLEALAKQLEEAENKQANARIRNAPYFEKKAEYINARKIHQAAFNELEMQRVKQTQPQMLITMWEKATASRVPATPRIGHIIGNAFVAGILGLLIGCALAFIAVRAKKSPDPADPA